MILTFEFNTWFNVTLQPLPKYILVKLERERKYGLKSIQDINTCSVVPAMILIFDLEIWLKVCDPLRDRNSEARAATNVFPSQYHKMNTVLSNVDSYRYVIYMIIKQITH